MRPFTMVTSATIVAMLAIGTACAKGEAIGPDTATASVRSVEVTPGSATLGVGESVQLYATVMLTDDRPGAVGSWTTFNAAVATVNGAGMVRAEGEGTAWIVARSGNVSDTALVTVAAGPPPPPPPPPATAGSVVIDPRGASIPTGQTVQFTAVVRDAGGAVMNGRTAEWRVGNSGVASISSTGLATASAAGNSYVIASADARADTVLLTVTASPPPPPPPAAVATVTVTPASVTLAIGATRQLSATMRDASGNVLSGRAVTWSSSSTASATVSTTGMVTAVAAGSATITATSEGRSGTATITVSAPPPPPPPPPPAAVATVSVTPASASIAVGATRQLTATLRDASGNVLTGRAVTWSSGATAVATVNGSGLVSGASAGSATITATSEGRTGTASITVTAPPPPSTRVDTIFYEGFESGSMAIWDDGYSASQHRILTDAAGASVGSRYLQVTNLQGADGLWLTKFFMPGYDSVYVRYYVKLAANWQSGTKLLAVYGNRTDNQWSGFGQAGVCSNGTNFFNSMVVTEPSGGDPPPMRFYTYHADLASTGSCYGEYGTGRASYTPNPFTLTRGVWHKIEFWVKANTVGQSNGSQRYWVDGVLRADWSGIRFRTSNILRLNAVQLTFNQAFGSPQTQLIYVDDLLVTTAIPANR